MCVFFKLCVYVGIFYVCVFDNFMGVLLLCVLVFNFFMLFLLCIFILNCYYCNISCQRLANQL